jgi:hypothetical protein
MSRGQYQKAAKSMYWMLAIWTVLFAVTATWLIEVFGTSISDYGRLVRGNLGELLGGLVVGLTLGVLAALAWLAVVLPLDRSFGLRCPHCHRSLTLRCRHERVLQTGQCSLCGQKVLNES